MCALAAHGYVFRTYQDAAGITHVQSGIRGFGWTVLLTVLFVAGATLYEGLVTAAAGRTVGKMAVGIRTTVVAAPGQRISGERAALRFLAFNAPAVILYLGSLYTLLDEAWCLWDPGRQCLHDKLARTIVVNDR